MQHRPSENHRRFLRHLEESQGAVWTAAQWLNRIGYRVSVPPTRTAPTQADWKKFADDGDLFIAQRVEVKRLSVSFTGRHDWPFGEDFIVCARHSFDSAPIKPLGYLILSADMGYAAVVRSDTRNQWVIKKRRDSRYVGVEQEFYFAPLACCSFFPITEQDLRDAG